MRVFKDYDIIAGCLYKFSIDEKKHLLWKEGGVPCIDKNVWTKYGPQVDAIRVHTNKGRTFVISKELFDEQKKEINLGFGVQYVVNRKHWTVNASTKKKLPDHILPETPSGVELARQSRLF